MKKIDEYRIYCDQTVITMPASTKIVQVSNQDDDICLWTESDADDHEWNQRTFRLFNTYDTLECMEGMELIRIGAVTTEDHFVYHVYEEAEIKPLVVPSKEPIN